MAHPSSPAVHSGAGTPHHVPFSRPTTPHLTPPTIGFYGLGSMGYEMARNLALHPYSHPAGPLPPLIVYNRTVAKSEALVKDVGAGKVEIAQNVEDFVRRCDIILTSFASDEVVKQVYSDFAQVLQKGAALPRTRSKIFVETSTIYPTLAGELDRLLSMAHVHFIACPIFGPPPGARARQLVLVMSGDYRAKKEVAYLLVPAIGRKAFDLGGNVEKAHTFKLIGNGIILSMIEVLAESMTLAEKTGVGAENVYELIKEVLPAAPFLGYAPKLLHDSFDGSEGFAIDGGIKDATHARALAVANNSPLPTVDVALQHLLTARAVHQGQKTRGEETWDILDWSALVAGPRLAAGLDAFDRKNHAKVVKDD